MGLEDFDDRIRRAFDEHEPEVKADWKRMQAALIGAAGGTTAAVVRARWVGGAAGAAAVAAAVTGWFLWNQDVPAADKSTGKGHQTTQIHPSVVPATSPPEELPSARTRTEVVISPKTALAHNVPPSPRTTDWTATEVVGNEPAAAEAETQLISSSVQEACAGTEVTFTLEGEWAKGSILWNFGDGTFSNDVAPVHVFAKEGTYDITISVRSPNDGAIRTRTVEDMIVIRPKPDAKMAWKLEPSPSGSGVRVALEDKTDRASSATWMQGTKGVSTDALVLNGAGVYPVTLVASNAYGCQDSRTDHIRLGDRNALDAPSAFSPDGDGRRDNFMPEGLRKGAFRLTIFDMNGKEVYSTTEFKAPWNGRLADGTRAPLGAMFRWNVVREVESGKPEFFSDRVRIER